MTEDAKKKRKKKISSYSTLGNPELDAKRFNSSFSGLTDTSYPVTDCGSVNMSMGDVGGGSAGAACGESLELDEKRETKRYYVRPQNVFCANKNDVLRALVDVANSGENCTVYSLKSLDDHDDVGKLTNSDIIYYYDENVLYDKNHELVMDYDLFIKHEEERKKFSNPDAVSAQEFRKEYDDRMTSETVVEEYQLKENLSLDGFKLALDKGEELTLGEIYSDEMWINFRDGEPYSHSIIELLKDNDKYIVQSWDMSTGGEQQEGKIYNIYDSFEEALKYIKSLDIQNCPYSDILNLENTFNYYNDSLNQTFEDYSLNKHYKKIYESFDEALDDESKTCVICGEEIVGYGNNAEPYKKGKCCDACNLHFVIPARLAQSNNDENQEEGE